MRAEALVEGLVVAWSLLLAEPAPGRWRVCVNAEIALGETAALIFSGAIVRSWAGTGILVIWLNRSVTILWFLSDIVRMERRKRRLEERGGGDCCLFQWNTNHIVSRKDGLLICARRPTERGKCIITWPHTPEKVSVQSIYLLFVRSLVSQSLTNRSLITASLLTEQRNPIFHCQIVSQFERVKRNKEGRSDPRARTVQSAIVKWDHFIFIK